MNKILIPTDFSEHSGYALEYASFIAKEKGSKLVILHIIQHDNQRAEAEDKLKVVTREKFLKKLDVEYVIEEGGDIGKSINEVGVRLYIDLIVMGSNGASNLEEMLLGSNTENVIRKTNINVITIKHKMDELKVEQILFPSDFKPESYQVFGAVKTLANLFNAKVHLLYVNTHDHFKDTHVIEENFNKFIEYFDMNIDQVNPVIYDDKNEELGVLNYSIDHDIDIITIGSHGKNVLQKLLSASTSHNLVRDSFKPVLTIRF